jgi:hypothetical protein
MPSQLFKRLHVCWDKAQEHTSGMEHTNIEALIPLKEDPQQLLNGGGSSRGGHDVRAELEKKRGDSYRGALDEHNELVQQLTLKNKHLKEIIDQERSSHRSRNLYCGSPQINNFLT